VTISATVPHSPASSSSRQLSAAEFDWICRYLHQRTGILLSDGKQPLVIGRLDKRVRHYQLNSYREYFALATAPENSLEAQIMTDLLTTNETYFFREPKHFEFLSDTILTGYPASRKLRIWSAASSSGEEAYTLAMVIASHKNLGNWEIIGTDISQQMIEKATRALYPLAAAEKIPTRLLKEYCVKGKEEFEGFLRIHPGLRAKVRFSYANLIEELPDLGSFDVIFLRNVMIYFDKPTKQKLIHNIQKKLCHGGHLIISHSETLNGMDSNLKQIAPSIYQLKTS